ncbi:MAG: hypothetical protein Q4B67_03190 [Eubacteriales bacterium]|nr:hypothetical protein [Eubacteriales bacterium]
MFFSFSEGPADAVSINSSLDELKARVTSLTEDETYVYEYLRRCFSRRWIAETLFISQAKLRSIIKSLCRKLGVSGVRSMLRIYSRLQNVSFREPVDAKMIDDYVERRTEEEIKAHLKEDSEN